MKVGYYPVTDYIPMKDRDDWEDLTGHRAESDLATEYHIAKLTRLKATIANIERELWKVFMSKQAIALV